MNSRNGNNSIRVLLVDDEEVFVEMTAESLRNKGFQIETASNADKALDKLDSRLFDVVLLDIRMPGMDGLELLNKLSKERPTQQVVMLSGHATVPDAIEAMRLGAFDFLLKPVRIEELITVIGRAAERGELQRSNIALEQELQRSKGTYEIVGESEPIKKIFSFINKASKTDLPVLITGESGTGKELVARAIHQSSKRRSKPFIVVDGSTLQEQLLASELFGHEKGAFTGAVKKKAGLFEVADRGSIFMDEIGELSTQNQVSLLRVLEYGTFRPLGSNREVQTDVRIIAATNKDIVHAVADGEFREDLYYRLKGLAIEVPPLRERRTDIPLLAKHFLEKASSSLKIPVKLSKESRDILLSYNWPGNVRELAHVIQLAALFAVSEGEIQPKHLPEEIKKKKQGRRVEESNTPQDFADCSEEGFIHDSRDSLSLDSLEDFRSQCERGYIKKVLDQFDGNKSQTAKALGISRGLLYKKLKLLDL